MNSWWPMQVRNEEVRIEHIFWKELGCSPTLLNHKPSHQVESYWSDPPVLDVTWKTKQRVSGRNLEN